MCGICGIVSGDPKYSFSKSTLVAMRDCLAHRGPDDFGSYLSSGIALGSRRLTILDLSQNGKMPMSTENKRYTIIHNGEIYNYKELRSYLHRLGYSFRSTTDTEVLLYLYEVEGPALLNRINGMFAFAIWDGLERSLFLARDRLGIKPLYYAWHESTLYFASEIKALFAGGVPIQFDLATREELLCFRYVAGEDTPFVGVRRLLPGHHLICRDGQIQISRWWNLSERIKELRESLPHDPICWYQQIFDNAVNLRRISDVPLGVLLSGGLDSGSVAASLAHQTTSKVNSFTVRFTESEYDEGPLARDVADCWNLDYHELTVAPGELMDRIQTASRLSDEPLVHASDLHLLAISRYAKPRVTVLLSGEGGDETLGGYVRYIPLGYPMLLNIARPVFPWLASVMNLEGRLGKLGQILTLSPDDRLVLFNACDIFPSDLSILGMHPNEHFSFREQVLSEARSLYQGDLVRQAMYSDHFTFLSSILHRNDRMTMGASVECRVPFLDHRLVEGVAALPSSVLLASYQNKFLLRNSVGTRLPDSVRKHRKWGFGVPWHNYLRHDPACFEFVNNLANHNLVKEWGLIKMGTILQEYLAGNDRRAALVQQIFTLAIWWDEVVEGGHRYSTLNNVD